MRLGKWQFKPTLWPTLVTLVLLVILILLGNWQLRRADYKRGLLAQFRQVVNRAPLSLNQALDADRIGALARYQHVEAQGHYVSARQVLLQNMQHGDQMGYEVLTPFVLEPERQVVLVNRGFLAQNQSAKGLPDVQVDTGTRRISGILGTLPVPGIRLGKTVVPSGWPKLMLFPRYNTLAELYAGKLLKPVLLLGAGQTDGFVRDWQPNIGLPPVRHDAYALQWYALALALLIIWIVVNSKRIKHD